MQNKDLSTVLEPSLNSLTRIMALLFVLSLLGCASSPPDVPVCVEITMSRGYCINTISAKEFAVDDVNKIDGKSWWESRPSMLMMPAQSWAKLKTWIIVQCKRTGQCDKEISSWDRTIKSVDQALEAK